jgi:ketosteroid isomerase-like protein
VKLSLLGSLARMSESPVAVVRALFERASTGDVDSVIELLAPDARFVVPPEASAEPDTYEGHEGARRYFRGFDGVLDEVRFELIELEQAAPDTVLAVTVLHGRGTTTGIPVEQRTYVVITVRAGLVSGIRSYASRPAALAGLGSGSR